MRVPIGGDHNTFKAKVKLLLKEMYRYRQIYLMILPGMITIFIFHYIPIYGVQIAFKDFRSSLGIWGSEWVGFKHFIRLFNYPYFKQMIRNTLSITLLSMCTFPCPIIFALMLNEMKSSKLKMVCQQITYAPHFVSTVVVCSMLILFTQRDGGLFNVIAGFFGAEPTNLLGVPEAFAPLYVFSGLWQGLGWGTIIYLASLSGVSPELIEAAKIDGATRLQVIWHVDLPHLKPTIVILLIMDFGSLLSVGFEKVFLLQNSLNLEASTILATYTYELGIIDQQYSYSSAVGLFNNIISIILVVIANTISKKLGEATLF